MRTDCKSVRTLLTLRQAKKSVIYFAFLSLNRTLPLRGEITHARASKKTVIYFAFRSLNRNFDFVEGSHARE